MKKYINQHLVDYWEKGYLYIALAFGIYIAWFFSNNVGILDWIKEIAYFEYFKTAFNDYHSLPYFWWNILEEVAWRPPIPGTSALVANPETALFSPFIPLLIFFEVKTFMKLYIIIQLLLGVVGSLLLRRKLAWSNSQFRIFTVLFLFSPIIMQHIAVAYFTWYNFYLFPWLILFIAEKNNLKSIIGISSVLGLVVLQGGIYIVQYLGLFYMLYEIFHIIFEREWKRIPRLLFIPIFAVLLSWARLSTTTTVYGEYIRPWVEIDGYNLSFFLFYAIIPTITIPPLDLGFHSDFLGWSLTPHDSGLFWGLALVMLVVILVRYKVVVKTPQAKDQRGLNYNAIFIAAIFLLLISFYHVWYLAMKTISALNLPLFESIKNHGIRFIMGAFFAYAILLANYSEGIWKELQIFIKTRIWRIIKKSLLLISKGSSIFLGVLIVFLKMFYDTISERVYEIINQAYNGTAYEWLAAKMEGLQLNSLEFYYSRFDTIYETILRWLIIIFLFLLAVFLVKYLINKNKDRLRLFLKEYPYFKFEMLLAIPLIISMSMWTNLASSVPFKDIKTQSLMPPNIELLMADNTKTTTTILEVSPKYLKIEPSSDTKIDGYYLSQIPARDSIWFDIISNNAIFSEIDGKMIIIPLNDSAIELQFRTKKIHSAIVVTIIAWSLVFGYSIINMLNKRKQY